MGCFSYKCKGCNTPINSTSFDGEFCNLFLLKDGVVIESMTGPYDSYGAVFNDDNGSQKWNMDWGDVCNLHFNSNPGDGIAAFHERCFAEQGRQVPNTISDDDPEQGFGKLRRKFMG
jgi:hypothetical protein